MPWCPNCKTEYRFGISHCTDCGSLLTEERPNEFEYVPLVELEAKKEEFVQKLLSFLENEGITDIKLEQDEAFNTKLLIPENHVKRAEKIVAVFLKMESEQEFSALTEEEKAKKLEDNKQKSEKALNTHVYTKAEDRYKDNVSTAWTFLVLGILGLGFSVLNILGVLNFMAGMLQYIVSVIMFLAFIGAGIFSFKRNSKLKEAIQVEAEDKKKYKEWFNSFSMDEWKDTVNQGASDEENEILLVNFISEKLIESFPEINENFADSLADEFFSEIRDQLLG